MNIKRSYVTSIMRSYKALSVQSRRVVLRLTFAHSLIAILDLLALLAIGVVSAIAVTGFTSQPVSSSIQKLLIFVNMQSLNYEHQIALLLIAAIIFLLLKTLFSMFISSQTFRILSKISTEMSFGLLESSFFDSKLIASRREAVAIHFMLTQGVNAVVFGIVGSVLLFTSDVLLLTILTLGLFYIDPLIAAEAFFFFGLVGIIVFKLNRGRAAEVGQNLAKYHSETESTISSVWNNLTELHLRQGSNYFFESFRNTKVRFERDFALQGFLPNAGKYYGELTIVIGSAVVGFSQFLLRDLANATVSLAVFMVATSRIAPALLRMYQSTTQIQISRGTANMTLDELQSINHKRDTRENNHRIEIDSAPSLNLRKVYFSYKNSPQIINGIDMKVSSGEFVAIVGPSGAGKSTLLQLIMGTLLPANGEVKVGELTPSEFTGINAGCISYVPQQVNLVNGNLRDNVLLGFENDMDPIRYKEILELTMLDDFKNLDETDLKMSGGEKQRVGMARALLTKPKLLILDEPTSALDSQTERSISDLISRLKGQVTIVMVAHRLSTVRSADRVFYLKNGLLSEGASFQELRKIVPDFEKEVQLFEIPE